MPTGVKHLHHEALKYDVGVYFEANGHGTVVFSAQAIKAFSSKEAESPAQAAALKTLLALTSLINQTVGDAISDLDGVLWLVAKPQALRTPRVIGVTWCRLVAGYSTMSPACSLTAWLP